MIFPRKEETPTFKFLGPTDFPVPSFTRFVTRHTPTMI